MKAALFFAALTVAVGCGSRSGLLSRLETDASGGGGGQGGSPNGGSSGLPSGGGGGAPSGGTGGAGGVVTCNALDLLSPVLQVEPGPANTLDDGLVLTESSDEGARVTGVFVRQSAKLTNVVHHVSLFPWTSWPTSEILGPVRNTTLESDEYDVARSPGSRVALAARLAENTFLPDLDPDLDGPPAGPYVPLPDIYPADVALRAANLQATSHLVATGDGVSVSASVVVDGALVSSTGKLGCSATQPPRIGAVPFQDGWLVAASTGAPPFSCDDPGAPPPGPPDQIDVYRIDAQGGAGLVTVLGPAKQIIDLHTAPHPSGMYVVWSDAAQPALAIFAARVDGVSGVAVGATSVQAPGEISSGFRATALGTRLLVARKNGDFASSQKILLSLFDESLTSIATGSLEWPHSIVGPTSALGSRDGRSLLIAFTTQQNQKFRAQLARFDCEP
jgi:hypothetical protein